jgi:hypothetical protein
MAIGLTLAPNYEITMELPCSLERARSAFAINLRSPAFVNLPEGTPVGSVQKNEFSFHFRKPGRNFWRPEFRGRFSATNGHARIFVWCGLSDRAEVFTLFYWGLVVLASFGLLGKFTAGDQSLHDFCLGSLTVVFSFVVPVGAFWKEFRDDRIQMKAILDSLKRQATP